MLSEAGTSQTSLFLLSALIGGMVGMALFLPLTAVTGPLAAYTYPYFLSRGLSRAAASNFMLPCFCAIPAADLGAVLGAISGWIGYWIQPRRWVALLAAALGGAASAFLVSLWMAVYIQ